MDSEFNVKLNDLEDRHECGKSYRKFPNKLKHQLWNTREIITDPCALDGTPDALYSVIGRNVRRAIVRSKGVSTETYLVGVCNNYAILNYHSMLGVNEDVSIRVSTTGVTDNRNTVFHETKIGPYNSIPLGSDLIMVALSNISFRDIVKHFNLSGKYPNTCDAMVGSSKVRAFFNNTELHMENSRMGTIVLPKYWEYVWEEHTSGKCGLPLVIQSNKGSCIAGIHTAGRDQGVSAFSTVVTQVTLKVGISALEDLDPMMKISSEGRLMLDLVDPIHKSPVNFEVLHGLCYLGKTPGAVLVNSKSRLAKTPFSNDVLRLFRDTMAFTPTVFFGPPLMKPKNTKGNYIYPINIALSNMSREKVGIPREILKKAVDIMTTRFVTLLRQAGVKDLKPLDIETAVNGAKLDPFIRRMNASTSSGFGLNGLKSDYLPIVEENDDDVVREPESELKDLILNMITTYENGEMCHPVNAAKLKDEPRPIEKIKTGKTRVFYAGALTQVLVSRQFLAPFYSLMVEYNDIFCTSVGINMHADPDFFYKRFLSKNLNIMEGDYGKYDQTVPYDIALAVSTVIINVLRELGYSEINLSVVQGILSDNLLPVIEALKDIYIVPGLQPSGKYATAEDNSLKGLMLLW
jgi:hypothetical protein